MSSPNYVRKLLTFAALNFLAFDSVRFCVGKRHTAHGDTIDALQRTHVSKHGNVVAELVGNASADDALEMDLLEDMDTEWTRASISSKDVFIESRQHRGPEMGQLNTYTFQTYLKRFTDAFTRGCSAKPESRFHIQDTAQDDLGISEGYPVKYWDAYGLREKFIETSEIPGCNGNLYNGMVCHVVFKLNISAVSVEPLAGLTVKSSGGETFYIVGTGGRKFYGMGGTWSQMHSFHVVPGSVLEQNADGSFRQKSGTGRTLLLSWSCDVPPAPAQPEARDAAPVIADKKVEKAVQLHEVHENQAIENRSSSEICCCAKVGSQMRAFGVQLAGIQGGSPVELAVGHNGWWSGTPDSHACPKIGDVQEDGTPCACTTSRLLWKAPKTCKSDGHHVTVGSHSPAKMGTPGNVLECLALCSAHGRIRVTQQCRDPPTPVNIEMTAM